MNFNILSSNLFLVLQEKCSENCNVKLEDLKKVSVSNPKFLMSFSNCNAEIENMINKDS